MKQNKLRTILQMNLALTKEGKMPSAELKVIVLNNERLAVPVLIDLCFRNKKSII